MSEADELSMEEHLEDLEERLKALTQRVRLLEEDFSRLRETGTFIVPERKR